MYMKFEEAIGKILNEGSLTMEMEELMDFLFGDDIAPVIEPIVEKGVLILDYSENKGDIKEAKKIIYNYSPDFKVKVTK
jgi:hypothetical protein